MDKRVNKRVHRINFRPVDGSGPLRRRASELAAAVADPTRGRVGGHRTAHGDGGHDGT